MSNTSNIYRRRSPRLKGYDYSQLGAYFVTICIQEHRKLFGEIRNDSMNLNPVGELTEMFWNNLPDSFPGIELDLHVIMPNHFHGIVVLSDSSPLGTSNNTYTLGQIIRTFKARTSYSIHEAGAKEFRWQQKYWDSIIRDERHLNEVRQYIIDNPAKWARDKLYR